MAGLILQFQVNDLMTHSSQFKVVIPSCYVARRKISVRVLYVSFHCLIKSIESLFQCIKNAQPAFTCPKSAVETPEQCVKYFKS